MDKRSILLWKVVTYSRKKQLLCIITILFSGIDVQTCNVVIHFSEVISYNVYVQTKGRARAKSSRFIVMVEEKDQQLWRTKLDSVIHPSIYVKLLSRLSMHHG